MTISAQSLKRLFDAGLTPEQLVIVAEEIEREMQRNATERVASALHPIERRPMTSTERSRLYRNKAKKGDATKRNENATNGVASALQVSPIPPSSEVVKQRDSGEKGSKKVVVTRGSGADEVVALWNRFAEYANASGKCAPQCRVSKVEKITESRRASAAKRVKSYSIEQMTRALNIARQTPGILGHNDRKWIGNFDWFVRPNTVALLLEGKYENWKPTQSARQAHASEVDAALARQNRFLAGGSQENDPGGLDAGGPVIEGHADSSD